jgi:DNA-directed RNA polymerase subunit P
LKELYRGASPSPPASPLRGVRAGPPGMSASTAGSGIYYVCIRCGRLNSAQELATLPEIRCECGYRVLKKARPGIVKTVKTD